jgi:DNA-binding XRE family transcriptional regulator
LDSSRIIKELKKKMSKYKIAQKLDVTWQTIHMWEKGVFKPREDKMKILLKL